MSYVFDPNKFKINTNYVIDASAGTGKTYNIIEIVRNLTENNISLENVLLCTYTEKAAGELKDRIRKNVPNADVDNSYIGTIHSFCKRIIEEYCISSGKPSSLKLIDESEVGGYIKQYLRQEDVYKEIVDLKKRALLDPEIASKNIEDEIANRINALIGKYYLDNCFNEDKNIIEYIPALPGKGIGVVIIPFVTKHIERIYKGWQETKEKNNWQTYNDMIRTVREEVVNNKSGAFLKALKDKFKYAIVDEFQDTNQLQWDFIKAVFLDDEHNIIVVGDPKQSIYSFQGADFQVYLNAKNEIISHGGEDCYLDTNYRSTEILIDRTNEIFENHMSMPDFIGSKCGLKSIEAKYEGASIDSLWICHGESEDGNFYAVDENAYANVVCQTIIDCCSDDGKGNTKLTLTEIKDGTPVTRDVTFNDFVILARKSSELPPITKALKESGIPYLRYQDRQLFFGPECASWIAVLEAIDTPDFTGANRSKFRKALYSVFFGKSLMEINSSVYDKDTTEEFNLFERWKVLAEEQKWEDLIDAIVGDCELESKMNSLTRKRTLEVINQIGDFCIDFLSDTHSIKKLVIKLKELAKTGSSADEDEADNTIEKASDYDSVKIMTIHASKGLGFPVVISVAGFKGPKPSDEIYSFHNADKRILSFVKDTKAANKESSEEERRLYYVAYTRAKYVLMLPFYAPITRPKEYKFISESVKSYIEQSEPYRRIDSTVEDYSVLSAATAKILSNTTVSPTLEKEKEDQENILKGMSEKKREHSSYKHAYSSLSHSKAEPETITDEGISKDNGETTADKGLARFDPNPKLIACEYDSSVDSLTLSDNFPAGAGLGNALHEIFEIIDYKQGADTKNIDELTEERYRKNGLRFKPEWLSDTRSIIDNVLGTKLPEIHGSSSTGSYISLKDIEVADRLNEVEFNFNKEDQKLHHYFNGFIDLIFRQGEYYSILDWKSDRLNDEFTSYSDKDSLKKHVDELYAIQRVLYSYTLIKWLKNFYKDLTEQEIFEQHFGGVYYVFLRGCNAGTGNGIYAQTWESYKDLEDAYNIIIKEKVRG